MARCRQPASADRAWQRTDRLVARVAPRGAGAGPTFPHVIGRVDGWLTSVQEALNERVARYPPRVQWLVPLGFMLLPIAALALMMFLTLTVAESDLVDGSGWALLAVGSMALLVAMPDGRQLLRLLVRPSEAAVAAYLGAHVSLASSGRALETVPGQAENGSSRRSVFFSRSRWVMCCSADGAARSSHATPAVPAPAR